MPTFVMMTKLSHDAIKDPSNIETLGRQVSERIRTQCPGVRWLGSYAIMGPCDYLDIFEAPDDRTASKVALIVRSYGHGTTETWLATPWERFLGIVKETTGVVRSGV
ncbi:MAG: GYD domain-containing protein [Armatimonadetes bacterium]|nr:GYD domain-containing protein [Armatimonadota bacterium]